MHEPKLRANAKGDLAKLDYFSHDALNTTLHITANGRNAKFEQLLNSNVLCYKRTMFLIRNIIKI